MEMTNDELLSKTISYLRFPLTVGVVFIHFTPSDGLTFRAKWFFFIVNIISQVWATIGVPLFFIISGFLFFYRKDFDCSIYKQKLKSRARTLLIPFLLWNLIAIVWQLKCFLPIFSSFYRPVEIQVSFLRIINTFLCNTYNSGIFVGPPSTEPITGLYPIDVPLWYVRDLMAIIIMSPIIYFAIKKTKQWFILVVGLFWLLTSIILQKGNSIHIYIGMLLTASFFFSWGAFYSINKNNIVLCFREVKYSAIIYFPIAIADALTKGLEFNIFIHKIGILFGVVAAVVVVSLLLESNKVKVNTILANSSFFVFALHTIFMGDFVRFLFTLFHIPVNNPYAILALYFFVPFFCVLVCLSLYLLLKRYFPKTCNLLTGGR